MAIAVLQLEHDGAHVSLRLEDDPRRERRALAHGGGFALSHGGELAPGPMRDLVIAIGRAFAGRAALDLDDAIAALQAIAVAAGARLTRARLAPGGRALPRWPSNLRTGAPHMAAGSIWPFDPELAGLRLGARRVAKRECFDDDSERADRAWLEASGATVARAGEIDPDGRRVLLAAMDPAALGDGLVLAEAALQARDRDLPARALGAALGYPPCCVDAFLAADGRDDLSLLALLPPIDAPPAPPWTQWLNAPLALISHTPCTLTCEPTIALARALCAELDQMSPGFAAAWRDLAARFQVVDHRGRGLAIRGEGALATGVVIAHALALAPDPAGVAARELPELVGRTVRVGDDDLDGPMLVAALGADHTG